MFRALTTHFARRLVQSGGTEVDMSLGALLALLASPGVFIAIGLLDKYSSLLRYFRGVKIIDDPYPRAVGDGYSLLVFSMAITGLVTLWKWDRILPDLADRLNLGPLPLPARTVFLSSLAAIALVVSVFILDVNAGSILIFPMVVTADQTSILAFLRLTLAHFLVITLGSLFAFCCCFSVLGVVVALAPGRWFGALSLLLRAAMGLGLLAMWLAPKRSEWAPGWWFAGLYGPLLGRPDLGGTGLWQRGLWALLAAVLVALIGYGVGYRRGMQGGLVRSAARRRWPRWLLDHGATPLERAAFRFSILTLWRSEAHSLLLVALTGAGFVIGLMQGDHMRLPFYAGYSLIVAIRVAMSVPAVATANWPFRLLSVASNQEPIRVARRLMWVHFAALILAPTLLVSPWPVTIVLAPLGAILIEVLILTWNQIPFTVRSAGFRNSRLVHVLLILVGLGAVPWAGGHGAEWIARQPWRACSVLAVTGALLYYRPRAAVAARSGHADLVFEDNQDDVIRLSL